MSGAASEKTIAIVGAGLVGLGWAIDFARAGCRVKVYDQSGRIMAELPGQSERSWRIWSVRLVEDLEGEQGVRDRYWLHVSRAEWQNSGEK